MALPKQVQQQVEEAERIQAQLAGTPAVNEDTPPEPPPSEPPAEPPVAAAPEPTPPQPADDGWHERYKALQGKYNAEVGRLNEAVRGMSAQMEALRAQMAQAQRPPEPPKVETPLVTTKDEETFGSDLLDVVRRVTREESRAVIQRLESLEQLAKSVATKAQRVDEVEQRVAQSQEQLFYTELAKAVPNWEEVNRDERWLKWLAEVDPMMGRPRQAALDEASQKLDPRRTAAIFKLFLSQVAPPAAPQPNQAQAELARQVAPAKSSKTTSPPQGAKVYTGQEYIHWLDPRRVHDTDPAKLQQMLAEMERAFAENRVQF